MLITNSFKSKQIFSTYYILGVLLLHHYSPKRTQDLSQFVNNDKKVNGILFSKFYLKDNCGRSKSLLIHISHCLASPFDK